MGFIDGFFRGALVQIFGNAANNLASRVIQGSDYKYNAILIDFYKEAAVKIRYQYLFDRKYPIPFFSGETTLYEVLKNPFIKKNEFYRLCYTVGLFFESKGVVEQIEKNAKEFAKQVSNDPSIVSDHSSVLSKNQIAESLMGVFYFCFATGKILRREFTSILPYEKDMLKICRSELTNDSIKQTLDLYFCFRTKVLLDLSTLFNNLEILDKYKSDHLGRETIMSMFTQFPKIPEFAIKKLKEKNLEGTPLFKIVYNGLTKEIAQVDMNELVDSLVIAELLLQGCTDDKMIDNMRFHIPKHLEEADPEWREILKNVIILASFVANKIDYTVFKKTYLN